METDDTLEDVIMSMPRDETELIYHSKTNGVKVVKDISAVPAETRALINDIYDIADRTGWALQKPLLSVDSDDTNEYRLFLKSESGSETFISFDKDSRSISFAKYLGELEKYQRVDIASDPLVQEIQKYAGENAYSVSQASMQ